MFTAFTERTLTAFAKASKHKLLTISWVFLAELSAFHDIARAEYRVSVELVRQEPFSHKGSQGMTEDREQLNQ